MTELSQGQGQQLASNRTSKGHAKVGCRVVYVAVPEQVFNHAKAQAYLSGLAWPQFVEKLLEQSTPIRG